MLHITLKINEDIILVDSASGKKVGTIRLSELHGNTAKISIKTIPIIKCHRRVVWQRILKGIKK